MLSRILFFFDQPRFKKDDQTIKIDWSKDYPFSVKTEPKIQESKKLSISKISSKFDSLISSVKKKIGVYTSDNIILYSHFTEMANLYNKATGWNLVSNQEYNGVINMGNGFLTTLVEKRNVDENVSAVSDFKAFLDVKGIPLLYVQVPYKICKEDASLSDVIDFSNQNANDFLSGLKKQGIEFLDLRDELHQQGLNHLELYYKTDHHWRAETGLWAAGVLSKHLNDHYDFDINLSNTDPLSFDFVIYKDWFLGSQGKKVTLSRADPEDISLIYPKFDVNLTLRIPTRQVDLNGDFEIIYDYNQIEKIDYYVKSPYVAYMYGDNAISTFCNHQVNESHTILVIGDSNDNSLVPFLALGIQNVDSLDLRHFNGSLRNLIEKSNYDIVIINYNPSALKDIDDSLHDNLFDFR